MKNTILIIIGILIFSSCKNNFEEKETPNFEEKELSFLHLRFGYDTENKWIKKPENILMIHETLKKIGYKNLIQEEEWADNWVWYLGVNKNPRNLIDSLELTFANFEESPTYYQEFWQRRQKERNKEVVYKVIQEIKKIMTENAELTINQELVNDTLVQLIKYEYPLRQLTNEEGNELLDYLIQIGLHGSAHNLISGENKSIENVKWNKSKEEILKLLNESEEYPRLWFQDDTK
jgi:hypothetical protein